MDAIKFIKEANRMCNSHDFCNGCPAFDSSGPCKILYSNDNYSAEEKFSIVEEWSKKNSNKTRQSVFLEQYPEAEIDSQGVLSICPAVVYGDKVCPKNEGDDHILCCDCRREFWMQEVE